MTNGGKLLYNTTDSLLSIFLKNKTFTENTSLTITGTLDMESIDENTMYISKSDGLYKFNNVKTQIKGSAQPSRCSTVVKNCKWLCKVDKDHVLGVQETGKNAYLVEKNNEGAPTQYTINGTVTNVSKRDKTIEIYTNTTTKYSFDKASLSMKESDILYNDVINSYTRGNGTVIFSTAKEYYFIDFSQDYNYQKLNFPQLSFKDVKSV